MSTAFIPTVPTPTWAVAVTHPQAEAKAAQSTADKGFATFYPRIQIRQRGAFHIEPMFPSYLFVMVHDAWDALLRCVGVYDVIRNGNAPARVSHAIITELKARCGTNGVLATPNPFVRGKHVRVMRGAFAGGFGEVESLQSKDRVALLLHMMSSTVRVTVDERDLELV